MHACTLHMHITIWISCYCTYIFHKCQMHKGCFNFVFYICRSRVKEINHIIKYFWNMRKMNPMKNLL